MPSARRTPRSRRAGGGVSAEELRDARMILWKGHCSVHGRFSEDVVDELREKHPGINVLVHPECRHEVVLKAELPEMKREEIGVTFENGILTLKGERKVEQDVKRENFQRIERRYGSFTRSFTLPNTVDASRISASYKDGVLTIRLPQREEAKPKQIAVSVE